jgi:tetratricopeptide (TPR) repeat protein
MTTSIIANEVTNSEKERAYIDELESLTKKIDELIHRQTSLGRRFMWLLFLPLAITSILTVMFFEFSNRLADVEVGQKLVTIERTILADNNYAWAVHQYETLAKTVPSPQILSRLGTLYFLQDKQGNAKLALETLERARDADPNYWEVFRNLTYVYTETGRIADAIKAGERAIELNADDANTLNNLAWIYGVSTDTSVHDVPKALMYASEAARLTRYSQADFLDTLAEVYISKGEAEDKQVGQFWLQWAIAVAPSAKKGKFQDRFAAAFPDQTP